MSLIPLLALAAAAGCNRSPAPALTPETAMTLIDDSPRFKATLSPSITFGDHCATVDASVTAPDAFFNQLDEGKDYRSFSALDLIALNAEAHTSGPVPDACRSVPSRPGRRYWVWSVAPTEAGRGVGVAPPAYSQPMGTRVVTQVTNVTPADNNTFDVDFSWQWQPTEEAKKTGYAGFMALRDARPHQGKARIQKAGEAWTVLSVTA